MRKLEEQFADSLVVVGVHSGKYHAERETPRIRDAALRLGVNHPVVNDRQFRIWRSYAVGAWPTVAVVDPRGYVVGMHAGEFTSDQIAPFVANVAEEAERAGQLVRGERLFPSDPETIAPGRLRYPGKVAVAGRRIAVADSGHHRILVGTLADDRRSARIERVVGGTGVGLEDGEHARFTMPQGLAFAGDTLYVADAGNHAVRAIDLATGVTRTVAGTGARVRTRAEIEAGGMASPWDLVPVGDTLFVAMAGTHQLWTVDPRTGQTRVHSGSGAEEIADGPHRRAALAQPMGIASDGERLFFADAESSAVRVADVDATGGVRTLVGTGLFDFGDVDGVGDAARLQHPQGVALLPGERLVVADSYNDALKWLGPATREARSWVRGFHEPGGVAYADGHVYVADTNAHRVMAVEVETGAMWEVALVD